MAKLFGITKFHNSNTGNRNANSFKLFTFAMSNVAQFKLTKMPEKVKLTTHLTVNGKTLCGTSFSSNDTASFTWFSTMKHKCKKCDSIISKK